MCYNCRQWWAMLSWQWPVLGMAISEYFLLPTSLGQGLMICAIWYADETSCFNDSFSTKLPGNLDSWFSFMSYQVVVSKLNVG